MRYQLELVLRSKKMAEKCALISIVIPCYNSEKTIINCLESVLSQTYTNIEVIVVDDGSNDQSIALVEEFAKLNSGFRINHILQVNAGPSSARNNGVSNAKGEWVAFLDADDYWKPEKLSIQMESLISNKELSLLGVLSEGAELKGKGLLFFIDFNELLFKNYFVTSGVILKKELAVLHPFNVNMKYSEDYRVWLTIGSKHKTGLINKSLCGPIVKKRAFGVSGLSANLGAMQAGEISNYKYLYDQSLIGIIKYAQCVTYSYLKYCRRLLLS